MSLDEIIEASRKVSVHVDVVKVKQSGPAKICAYCGKEFRQNEMRDGHFKMMKYCGKTCCGNAGKRNFMERKARKIAEVSK